MLACVRMRSWLSNMSSSKNQVMRLGPGMRCGSDLSNPGSMVPDWIWRLPQQPTVLAATIQTTVEPA